MYFAKEHKASKFANMIVKSALIFLGVVDFFWNAFEYVSDRIGKLTENKVIPDTKVKPAKPSYLIQ